MGELIFFFLRPSFSVLHSSFFVLRSSFFVLRSYLKVDNVGPSCWKDVHITEEAKEPYRDQVTPHLWERRKKDGWVRVGEGEGV